MRDYHATSQRFQLAILSLAIFLTSELTAESLPEKRPALVGSGPKSLVNLIDTEGLFRKGQRDAWVMFECYIAPDGITYPSEFFSFSPESDLLKAEVLRKLRRANFIPAVYNHRRTHAYFAGTVAFLIVKGQPRLRVFSNHELDEIKSGTDPIAPQPVYIPASGYPLDWPRYPGHAASTGITGTVKLRDSVDETGKTTDVQVVSESQPGYKFAENCGEIYSQAGLFTRLPERPADRWHFYSLRSFRPAEAIIGPKAEAFNPLFDRMEVFACLPERPADRRHLYLNRSLRPT